MSRRNLRNSASFDASLDFNELDEVLHLEKIDPWIYRSVHVYDEEKPLFGGQVIAQAVLAAAATTVPERRIHSLHCYFLRAGTPSEPIVYHVEADRDGGSFSNRRVVARQNGVVIFNASMSLQSATEGPEHELFEPDELIGPDDDRLHDWPTGRLQSVQMRGFEEYQPGARLPRRFYARFTADLGEDALLHTAALGYLTDVSNGFAEVVNDQVGYLSTIDHVAWLHRQSDMREWHLVELHPRQIGSGRGLFTGGIFDTAGNLVASTYQESLYRWARK